MTQILILYMFGTSMGKE